MTEPELEAAATIARALAKQEDGGFMDEDFAEAKKIILALLDDGFVILERLPEVIGMYNEFGDKLGG